MMRTKATRAAQIIRMQFMFSTSIGFHGCKPSRYSGGHGGTVPVPSPVTISTQANAIRASTMTVMIVLFMMIDGPLSLSGTVEGIDRL